LACIKLTRIKTHPQDGIGPKRPRMLGQLFQCIIPSLGNHFEKPSLLPTKDGADTTKEIADDIAGSDTSAKDRPNDPDNAHAGAIVDGEDQHIFYHSLALPPADTHSPDI
jgi:hypothetical protein